MARSTPPASSSRSSSLSLMSAVRSLLLIPLLLAPSTTSAVRLLESSSLNPCMKNSKFSATLFQVKFTPDNSTLSLNIDGVSHISGNVFIEYDVLGYGYSVYHSKIDPCADPTLKAGFCPMQEMPIKLPSDNQVPKDVAGRLPSKFFSFGLFSCALVCSQ